MRREIQREKYRLKAVDLNVQSVFGGNKHKWKIEFLYTHREKNL